MKTPTSFPFYPILCNFRILQVVLTSNSCSLSIRIFVEYNGCITIKIGTYQDDLKFVCFIIMLYEQISCTISSMKTELNKSKVLATKSNIFTKNTIKQALY